MNLNLGCGQYRAPLGWINVDHPSAESDPSIEADIYCDAIDLPFKDQTVQRIYAGHLIEHLSESDLYSFSAECGRVLAPDGQLMIVCPDMDRINQMPDPPEWLLEAMRTDNEGRTGEHHLWQPTATSVLDFLEHEGWDAGEVPLESIQGDGWPLVAHTEWQCSILADNL